VNVGSLGWLTKWLTSAVGHILYIFMTDLQIFQYITEVVSER